ncbi:hypothetical protein quinque_013866 [Culex quinquefasciatus]
MESVSVKAQLVTLEDAEEVISVVWMHRKCSSAGDAPNGRGGIFECEGFRYCRDVGVYFSGKSLRSLVQNRTFSNDVALPGRPLPQRRTNYCVHMCLIFLENAKLL